MHKHTNIEAGHNVHLSAGSYVLQWELLYLTYACGFLVTLLFVC